MYRKGRASEGGAGEIYRTKESTELHILSSAVVHGTSFFRSAVWAMSPRPVPLFSSLRESDQNKCQFDKLKRDRTSNLVNRMHERETKYTSIALRKSSSDESPPSHVHA
jgi:hypothetical protein